MDKKKKFISTYERAYQKGFELGLKLGIQKGLELVIPIFIKRFPDTSDEKIAILFETSIEVVKKIRRSPNKPN